MASTGVCFTVTTWLVTAWQPAALVTVSVTVKFWFPAPVATNWCVGLLAEEVLLAPEAGSPKFHANVNPEPVLVLVNCTGTLAHDIDGEEVKDATGLLAIVTVT